MRRILLTAAVVLGVGASVLVAPTPPAAVSADDLATVQQAHFEVIEEIALWDAQTAVSRIGAVEGDPVAGTIDIGWVGQVPSEVQAIADEAAAQGIAVTFSPQEASGEQMVELAHDLAASMPVEGAFAIGIGADSLAVEVPTPEAAAEANTEAIPLEGEVLDVIDDTEQAAAAVGATVTVEETDTVPITGAGRVLEQNQQIDPQAAALFSGRSNDTAELSGGMRVQTQFRNGAWINCTSGFTGVYGHRPVIVTAAHCSDYSDGRGVRNASGTRIGTSDLVAELNDGARAYDLGVIAASYDARTLPRIYTSETSTVNITGTQLAFPPAGYKLCSSGQVTGWKCDITSGEAYVTCYSSAGGAECMHVQIVRSSGGSAFCLGDSGGPVVGMPTASGATAVGVVSGLKGNGGSCSPEGLIAPLSQLMSTVVGLQLHTAQADPAADAAFAILDRINTERRAAGLAPLAQDGCLSTMAEDWAGTMAAQSLAGSAHNPDLAADAQACRVTGYGENVGRTWGTNADANAIMNAWMASTGHRANILRSTFTHVGIGVERGSNGYWYYVLDFGRR